MDDDPSTRKLFSIHLRKAGLNALHAEDGIDAIVKLRHTVPKVIASDMEMPRMSGIEFISVVRRRFPPIPVVGLSGAIPNEVPAESKPDVWFDKNTLDFSELVLTVQNLALKVPDRVDLPQVVPIPVLAPPGVVGHFILTCTDCLRTFGATSVPEAVEGTAVCSHCDALVPFLIKSSVTE